MSVYLNGLGSVKKCAICNQEFEASSLWVYRRNAKWFHTYSCMIKYDRLQMLKKEESLRRQKQKQKERYELRVNNLRHQKHQEA